MKTLDRYVIRSFLYTAVMVFLVMMSLRIVVDLFVNMDEFIGGSAESALKIRNMASYYMYQAPAYLVELGGIIIVASAAFTVARMNHTNELTALMASGVSLRRVVLPIILLCLLMDAAIIYDQEKVIPRIADKLVRTPDSDLPGNRQVPVRLQGDSNGNIWYAMKLHQQTQEMTRPMVLVRAADYSLVGMASGPMAKPDRLNNEDGWRFYGGPCMIKRIGGDWLHTPDTLQVWTIVSPEAILSHFKVPASDTRGMSRVNSLNLKDPRYGIEVSASRFDPEPTAPEDASKRVLVEPRFTFRGPQGETLGIIGGSSARWVQAQEDQGYWQLTEGFLFQPSDLKADDVILRQSSRDWLDYMSSSDLARLIQLRRVPDRDAAMLVRHIRFTNPINNLVMLLLALPFILSRERNLKASAGMCLAVVAAFYVCIYGCRYMTIEPVLAAWLPSLIFGPVAVVMLDSVKT